MLLSIVHTQFMTAQEYNPPADSGGTKAKNLGFSAGVIYSNISFDSEPYFADSAGKVGRSVVAESPGLSAGLFYNIRPIKNMLLRPGAELTILPAKIEYDTDINHKSVADIWPVVLEFPISVIYSRNTEQNWMIGKKRSPEFGLAVRPAVPVVSFFDVKPTFKTFNLNADVTVGYPFKMKRGWLRTELFYSHGFYNIIGEDPKDFKTYTIKEIGRSYFGVRIMFN